MGSHHLTELDHLSNTHVECQLCHFNSLGFNDVDCISIGIAKETYEYVRQDLSCIPFCDLLTACARSPPLQYVV